MRKQHDLIERQSEELKSLRSRLEEQDAELLKVRCAAVFGAGGGGCAGAGTVLRSLLGGGAGVRVSGEAGGRKGVCVPSWVPWLCQWSSPPLPRLTCPGPAASRQLQPRASDAMETSALRPLAATAAAPSLLPCRRELEDVNLKSSATTELKILFEEPWMMQTSFARLRGDVPVDREAGSLCVLAGALRTGAVWTRVSGRGEGCVLCPTQSGQEAGGCAHATPHKWWVMVLLQGCPLVQLPSLPPNMHAHTCNHTCTHLHTRTHTRWQVPRLVRRAEPRRQPPA